MEDNKNPIETYNSVATYIELGTIKISKLPNSTIAIFHVDQVVMKTHHEWHVQTLRNYFKVLYILTTTKINDLCIHITTIVSPFLHLIYLYNVSSVIHVLNLLRWLILLKMLGQTSNFVATYIERGSIKISNLPNSTLHVGY